MDSRYLPLAPLDERQPLLRKSSSPSARPHLKGNLVTAPRACLVLLGTVILGAGTPPPPGTGAPPAAYSLTLVLQLAKPFRIQDMNDEWQDTRLLSEDQDSAIVEVVHHPLAAGAPLTPNPDWRKDYAAMTGYLQPTATENWDPPMRADLLAELRKDGIDPDRLNDVEVVRQVAAWAKRRSRFGTPFTSFFVRFPKGQPEVPPQLREAFDRQKPTPETPDQTLFEEEVLGRQMYYKKVHGACTSYAVYQATLLRALGIPTRIIVCIPPVDANDPAQKALLLAAVRHNGVRATLRHALPASSSHGVFSDHMFNEVFVGKRWVRLNYATLEQAPLDETYLGLQVHVLTAASLSDMGLAETWGQRYAHPQSAQPPLSSINPYRLLRVSEHLVGPNPEVLEELQEVHVVAAHWKNQLPKELDHHPAFSDDRNSDFFLQFPEAIPRYRGQLREFMGKASRHFLLESKGQKPLRATYSGFTVSIRTRDLQAQLVGFTLDRRDLAALVPGVAYSLRPLDNAPAHPWIVDPALTLAGVLPTPEPELHALALQKAYWREAIPMERIRKALDKAEHRSEFFVRVAAGDRTNPAQVVKFMRDAKAAMLLSAPGHPGLKAVPTGSTYSENLGADGNWMLVGFALEGGGRGQLVPGVEYALRPVVGVEGYTWPEPPSLILAGPSAVAR